jgi:hypothetical protein
MFENLLIWFDVIRGARPRRHLWQALSNFTENNVSSPWAKTFKRYIDDTYVYYGESDISYREWLGRHFWAELNLDDFEEI